MQALVAADEIWVLSYYRASELAGALLFGRLARRTRDADLACYLTKHCAEEARHAWRWTETIRALGSLPILITETYQSRYAREIGLPTSMPEVLALTKIFEIRIREHFTRHARRPGVHPTVRSTLAELLEEEKDHLAWVSDKLAQYQAEGTDTSSLLARYQEADARIYGEVMPFEKRLWDFLAVHDGEGSR